MIERLITDYYLSTADTACCFFFFYGTVHIQSIDPPANALNKIQFIIIIKTPTRFTPVAILRDKCCGIKSFIDWQYPECEDSKLLWSVDIYLPLDSLKVSRHQLLWELQILWRCLLSCLKLAWYKQPVSKRMKRRYQKFKCSIFELVVYLFHHLYSNWDFFFHEIWYAEVSWTFIQIIGVTWPITRGEGKLINHVY